MSTTNTKPAKGVRALSASIDRAAALTSPQMAKELGVSVGYLARIAKDPEGPFALGFHYTNQTPSPQSRKLWDKERTLVAWRNQCDQNPSTVAVVDELQLDRELIRAIQKAGDMDAALELLDSWRMVTSKTEVGAGVSTPINAVDKLMADATGHGIEEFGGPANRVVFLTRDDEPVVLEDPAPLMQALEKEMDGCLKSMPETTVEGPLIPGAGVVRFKRQPEDLNAVAFLLSEAKRYHGLMVSVASAFGNDPNEPSTWPSIFDVGASEASDIALTYSFKDYDEALAHAYEQVEEADG